PTERDSEKTGNDSGNCSKRTRKTENEFRESFQKGRNQLDSGNPETRERHKFDSGNQVLPTRKEKKRPTIQGIVAEQDRMKRIDSGNQSREKTGRAHTGQSRQRRVCGKLPEIDHFDLTKIKGDSKEERQIQKSEERLCEAKLCDATAKNLGVKQMKEDSDKGNKDVRDEIEDIRFYRLKTSRL
ncbi:hypothetical protein Tco_1309406, partial [Tanacetum coccineum]